jgi:hypothetical protein
LLASAHEPTEPLGDDLESNWERVSTGWGAIGRLSFDGLPDIAVA